MVGFSNWVYGVFSWCCIHGGVVCMVENKRKSQSDIHQIKIPGLPIYISWLKSPKEIMRELEKTRNINE